MKKPCRLDGSTQQLKSLHHASQPRAGADISNASNNPPDVCLGRTFQHVRSSVAPVQERHRKLPKIGFYKRYLVSVDIKNSVTGGDALIFRVQALRVHRTTCEQCTVYLYQVWSAGCSICMSIHTRVKCFFVKYLNV
jgi:hypothetical protein